MSEFHDLALERQVLGQMLRYPGVFDAFTGHGLRREDFFRDAHRLVFDGIAAVAGRGEEADLVTVGIELRKAGTLDEIGVPYFSLLPDNAVKPSNDAVTLIASTLAELAGKRTIQASLGKSLEDVTAAAEQASARASDERRVYDSAAQLDAIRQDSARDERGRVWLGISTLDQTLEGLRAGEVFGLMARPGIGKTLVLCHVTRAVADTGIGHVFFSLEMPAPQIVDRLAGAHYGLSRAWFRQRLANGGLDPEDYRQTFKRTVIVDAPGLSIAQMSAKLRQIQAGPLRGVPIRLVTIDHLGLVGGDRKMTTYDRVSTQAREIKELAKRFECSVMLAVQVNREQGGDGSKELSLGAARDSGVVEEAMDYLVAMRRLDRAQSLTQYERERYKDVLFCKVVKNRHGAPDTEVALRIESPSLRLREDPDMRIDDTDMSKIAAMPLRGRR